MLILSRKIDEKIRIGQEICLTVIEIRGDQVKIGIEAPRSIKVFRQEIFDAIQKENAEAASTSTNINALSSLFEAEK
ncbi:MAG TPA: carbon storage regulator CsrA [Treponemataceae bacterium]|nr:carbon storage regulator CsrA [Treponemataceae bacterium]